MNYKVVACVKRLMYEKLLLFSLLSVSIKLSVGADKCKSEKRHSPQFVVRIYTHKILMYEWIALHNHLEQKNVN